MMALYVHIIVNMYGTKLWTYEENKSIRQRLITQLNSLPAEVKVLITQWNSLLAG